MEQQVGELINWLKLVRKRRYLFIGVALLAMTLIIGYSYSLSKKYQADSTVFIESNVINNLVKGLAVSPDMDERIRVLKYALLSRDIIKKTLLELKPQLAANEKDLLEAVAFLQKKTDITTNGRDLFRVSIVDSDPMFARDYINTLIRTYVNASLVGKQEETAGASRFLDQQLTQFRQKLDQAEDNIVRYRKSLGGLLGADEKSLLDAIADYRRQIEEIDLTVSSLQDRRQHLQSGLKTAAGSAARDPVVRPDADEAQLQKRLQELLLSYTEEYPEVVKVKNELEALQRLRSGAVGTGGTQGALNPLQQQTRLELSGVDAQVKSLLAKKATLQQFMQQREAELKQLPETQKQLSALVQERDSYRNIYEQMLLRLNQSEVSRQMELGDQSKTFRVVDSALLPTEPVSPDMAKMILMAIAAGIAVGFGAVVLRENFNATVKSVTQLRDCGIEIIAMVPAIIDERLVARNRHRDWLVFSASGIYFTGILVLLVFELLKRMGMVIN